MARKTRLMLGFNFAKNNLPSALHTIQQWSEYAADSRIFETVFGLSTACHPDRDLPGDAMEMMIRYCRCRDLFIFDEYAAEFAMSSFGDSLGRDCHPFYTGFNYGSLVNRLLLLAGMADCAFLVRVDPGMRPPKCSFDYIAGRFVNIVRDANWVVSSGYDGRLAIRDLFVRSKKDHEDLVKLFTGIDPLRQITGGAMFTCSVPGIPAMGFERYGPTDRELTLVWGTDDTIFQILKETQGSEPLTEFFIPRFDPEGMRKSTVEYYRGICGMVFLSVLLRGDSAAAAESRARQFVRHLIEDQIDPAKYRFDSKDSQLTMRWDEEFVFERIAPGGFLTKICEGLVNHQNLVQSGKWVAAVELAKRSFAAGLFKILAR